MNPVPPPPPALPAVALPLSVVDRRAGAAPEVGRSAPPRRWTWPLALLATGAAAGLVLLALWRAAAPDPGASAQPPAATPARLVVALGRLTPVGELRALAAPFGAGDARVAEVLVEEGQQVPSDTPLVLFDSAPALEAALAVAEQQLASRQAAAAQAERAVSFSQADSAAALARAEGVARAAEVEYRRWAALVDQGFVSPAAADQRRAQRDEAAEEQRRARAALARHAGQGAGQPELRVAQRAVELALAERHRAATDLARAVLRAPADGSVITIHVQAGERPGAAGVLDFGDTRVMAAELELYQAEVARVTVGQRVMLRSAALNEPLTGQVSRIGLSVGRQRLTDTSPAANLDARVVLARVVLDAASSARARGLVGLEVHAHIETGTP